MRRSSEAKVRADAIALDKPDGSAGSKTLTQRRTFGPLVEFSRMAKRLETAFMPRGEPSVTSVSTSGASARASRS